jgi:hypothetical protein
MGYKKRVVEFVTTTATASSTVSLGAAYGRVMGAVVRNYADATKAGAGADTAIKLKLTDGNSDIFFLDALDRDYATAELTLAFGQDDTATGLGILPVDATGAAATAGATVPVVSQSPITVGVVNAGTATDYFSVGLLVHV